MFKRCFTWRLLNLSYLKRLHACKTDSLESRRIKIDLIMLFIIVHDTVKVNLFNGF